MNGLKSTSAADVASTLYPMPSAGSLLIQAQSARICVSVIGLSAPGQSHMQFHQRLQHINRLYVTINPLVNPIVVFLLLSDHGVTAGIELAVVAQVETDRGSHVIPDVGGVKVLLQHRPDELGASGSPRVGLPPE